MKIVIVGAGAVGTHLARMLSNDRQDVVLIDADENKLFRLGSELDIMTLVRQPSSIEGMKDASHTEAFKKALKEAKKQLPEMADYIDAIDPRICTSVTISTLHGCPPQEIESIARYLITEKKLHTLVKCNPTILGYDFARKRLDEAGFDYISFGDTSGRTCSTGTRCPCSTGSWPWRRRTASPSASSSATPAPWT